MNKTEVMIEVRDVYKHFGKVKALDGVSADVHRGEVWSGSTRAPSSSTGST